MQMPAPAASEGSSTCRPNDFTAPHSFELVVTWHSTNMVGVGGVATSDNTLVGVGGANESQRGVPKRTLTSSGVWPPVRQTSSTPCWESQCP